MRQYGYRLEDFCALFKRLLLLVLLIPLIVIGHTRYPFLKENGRRLFRGFVSATALLSVFLIAREFYLSYVEPHTWDFLPFYIDGRVAALGLDFYRPENYQHVFATSQIPFVPVDTFLSGIGGDLNTAFKYPPPTMLWFLPLGFFRYQTSHYIWTALNVTAICIDVILITRLFFANGGWLELATATSLLLLFPAARKTAYVEQTTFILLAWTLLFWRDRLLSRAGIWLAMATVIKPFMASAALYPVLKRKWGIIVTMLFAGIGTCGLTMLVFGPSSFVSFFTERKLANTPNIAYLEWPNQSLLATVLRITKYEFVYPEQYRHPLFIAGAIMLTATTVWIVHRLRSEHEQIMISLSLLLGLLLFPYSASHYSLISILPLLFLYKSSFSGMRIQHWRMTRPWAVCLLYVLFDVAAFYANLALWVIFVALYVIEGKSEANGRQSALIPG
jgi:hypothetical protein